MTSGVSETLGRLRHTWLRGANSPLARRFVALTVLCSSLLAIVMTTLQLSVDYANDRSDLDTVVRRLEQSILPGLAESLWVIDLPVIESQLAGIHRIDGVVYAHLTYEETEQREAGDPALHYAKEVRFAVSRGQGESAVALGTLTVRVSYDDIQARILRRALIILGTNFVKTAVVAAFVLLLYQLLVGRHLVHLAEHAVAFDPEAAPNSLRLDRQKNDQRVVDELTILETAMNQQAGTIEAYTQRLRDANKEQAEFTYAISHDLKSPINTVHMLLGELRQQEGSDLDDARAEIFDDMTVTVSRMGQLVEDVLSYARSVGEDMSVEPVDLRAEVDAILRDLAGDISQSGAEITVGDLPTVSGSPVQLRVLCQNLIANAIKFRDPDRRPKIEVAYRPDAEDGYHSIQFKDNGIGIDAAFHDHIFGLFKRLHNQNAYKGSGIGLSVCKRIVSNHDGRIDVFSKKGGGSAFTVVLPKR